MDHDGVAKHTLTMLGFSRMSLMAKVARLATWKFMGCDPGSSKLRSSSCSKEGIKGADKHLRC
eukprot:1151810-Pelagomonas_calceolata.AAC.3